MDLGRILTPEVKAALNRLRDEGFISPFVLVIMPANGGVLVLRYPGGLEMPTTLEDESADEWIEPIKILLVDGRGEVARLRVTFGKVEHTWH